MLPLMIEEATSTKLCSLRVNPSTASWSFTLTFNDPGTIAYFCEIHGAAGGIGMSGSITVEAKGGGGEDRPPTRFNSGFEVEMPEAIAKKVHVISIRFRPDKGGDVEQQIAIDTNVGSGVLLATGTVK